MEKEIYHRIFRVKSEKPENIIPTDMTGAVTTKYENQHPVKVQTSSFSYKIALIKPNNLNNR